MATKKFQYASNIYSGRMQLTQLPPGMSAGEQTIGGRPPGANAIRIKSIYISSRGYCNGTTYTNLAFGIALFNDIFSSTMAAAVAAWELSVPLAQSQTTVTNGTGQVSQFSVVYDEGEGPVLIGTQPNISAINLSGATTGFGVEGTIDVTYEWEWR